MIPSCFSFLSLPDFVRARRCSKHIKSLTEKPEAMPFIEKHVDEKDFEHIMKYRPTFLLLTNSMDLTKYTCDMSSVKKLHCYREVAGISKFQNLEFLSGYVPANLSALHNLKTIDCGLVVADVAYQLPPATIRHRSQLDPTKLPNHDLIFYEPHSIYLDNPVPYTTMHVKAVQFKWLEYVPYLKKLRMTAKLTDENADDFMRHIPFLPLDLEMKLDIDHWPNQFPEALLPKIISITGNQLPPLSIISKMTNLITWDVPSREDDSVWIRCEGARFPFWPHLNIIYFDANNEEVYQLFRILHNGTKPINHYPKTVIDIVPSDPYKPYTIGTNFSETYDIVRRTYGLKETFNVVLKI